MRLVHQKSGRVQAPNQILRPGAEWAAIAGIRTLLPCKLNMDPRKGVSQRNIPLNKLGCKVSCDVFWECSGRMRCHPVPQDMIQQYQLCPCSPPASTGQTENAGCCYPTKATSKPLTDAIHYSASFFLTITHKIFDGRNNIERVVDTYDG